MNESSPKNETESIRSDIDVTRRRMDDTMDALGDRLQPRHLLDEVLGYFRGNASDGESRMKHMGDRLSNMGERLGHSCNTAMHSVADTVKQNPVPIALIGAGVAWMIYSSRRDSSGRYGPDYSAEDAALRYDPDSHYDRPLQYPSSPTNEQGWEEQGESSGIKDKIADKAAAAGRNVKEKIAQAGDAAREKLGDLRERASDVTSRVRESTRETYDRTREKVVQTADQHPLEVGLLALAVGLVAGLAIPTPNAINRTMGPTADRLRSRTREKGRELMEKGRHVADAAVSAAKQEAQSQGLTPERLRDKTLAVAESAKEGAQQAVRQESQNGADSTGKNNPVGGDPSVARPAI